MRQHAVVAFYATFVHARRAGVLSSDISVVANARATGSNATGSAERKPRETSKR